ncbi:MAG: recombinase RecA, partial [Arenicellales bacterium]
GKDNARQYLKDHPEMADEIEEKLRVAMGISDAPEIIDAPDMAEEVAEAE